MPVNNRIADRANEIGAWRRQIHSNPELLFDTHETAAFVAEKLRAFGCDEVIEGLGRTGVVGVIKGQGSGRVIALRADMDALPILEATGLDYASKTPGKMHACGHDGHTAMLLGAAEHLCEVRGFAGTVIVIFQPAEEGGGGAKVMCDEGLMERFGIEEVYGMHNWPGMPAGQFAIRPGPFFAATDQFEVDVTGRGGHAAKPHETADPVVATAQIITALQTIASRNVDPVHQVVVSVTSVESASKAFNVIPPSVKLRGTVRTLDADVRMQAKARVEEIVSGVATAMGCSAPVKYFLGYPVMSNHDRETDFAAEAARAVSGQCDPAPLIMGGEDFAYMLKERPGAYILLGNGDTAPVHHPEYDFNDDAIAPGVSWWVSLVEQRLGAA